MEAAGVVATRPQSGHHLGLDCDQKAPGLTAAFSNSGGTAPTSTPFGATLGAVTADTTAISPAAVEFAMDENDGLSLYGSDIRN